MGKVVHVQVVDGSYKDVQELTNYLKDVNKNHPEFDFLITNDKIELRDTNLLIEELYKLHKMEKERKKNA